MVPLRSEKWTDQFSAIKWTQEMLVPLGREVRLPADLDIVVQFDGEWRHQKSDDDVVDEYVKSLSKATRATDPPAQRDVDEAVSDLGGRRIELPGAISASGTCARKASHISEEDVRTLGGEKAPPEKSGKFNRRKDSAYYADKSAAARDLADFHAAPPTLRGNLERGAPESGLSIVQTRLSPRDRARCKSSLHVPPQLLPRPGLVAAADDAARPPLPTPPRDANAAAAEQFASATDSRNLSIVPGSIVPTPRLPGAVPRTMRGSIHARRRTRAGISETSLRTHATASTDGVRQAMPGQVRHTHPPPTHTMPDAFARLTPQAVINL